MQGIIKVTYFFNNDFYSPSDKGYCMGNSLEDYIKQVLGEIDIVDDSIKMSHNEKNQLVIDFLEKMSPSDPYPVSSCIIANEIKVYETPIKMITPDNAKIANIIRNALRKDN